MFGSEIRDKDGVAATVRNNRRTLIMLLRKCIRLCLPALLQSYVNKDSL